jgi:ribosomal protein S18 acetylase RimI-like enzyme
VAVASGQQVVTIVRHAEPGEVEAAIDVWRAANPGSGLQEHPERLRRWSADPRAHLHVALDGDHLVGMVLSVLGRGDDGAGDVIPGLRHLIGLAVIPARRREGIARSLVQSLVDEARQEACDRVTLWVHTDNVAARRLFAMVGFRPTGRSELDDAGVETTHLELLLGDSRAGNFEGESPGARPGLS